jgi:integrase
MARKKPPKPARRKPGTGTVRHRAGRAQPWEAAFPLQGGTTRYDAFDTREAAVAHLDALVGDRDSGARNVAGGSTTADAFLNTWLAIKAPHIKATTLESYTYLLGFAVSYFKGWRIDSIQRPDADLFLNQFTKKYQNGSQLRAVCRQAFEYALEEEYIRKNPFQKAKAPQVERREGMALTVGQRKRLLSLVQGEPLEILWHLYSRIAFRRGEGMGLVWGDVDWERATVTIARHYVRVGSATAESTPKTKRSRRTVPLPLDLLEMLREHRKRQRAQAAADPDWVEHGLIFPAEHGAPMSIWHVRHAWDVLRTKAKHPGLRIHDLRHTALTILALENTPPSVLKALAGHESDQMSGHYTDHATLEDVRRALG